MIRSSTLPDSILEAAQAGVRPLADAIRRTGGAPIRQGSATTFLFIGEASSVRLRHWMDIFPELPAFSRHPGTELWSLTVELPEYSRIEYKLAIRSDGRRRLILDPLNPRRARDPFGTNSVVTGPRYARPTWSQPDTGIPRGTIESFEIDSAAFAQRRTVRLYRPPGRAHDALPLVVAHDGSEYVEYAALAAVLDNLIAAGDLPPVACLLTDPSERQVEYTGDERHAEHLAHELIPAASSRLSIDQGRLVAMGASLGAVASLHAAASHPGLFSGLVLQSGSFVTALGGRHRRGPVFAPVVEFMQTWMADQPNLPPRIYMSCGRFDGLIAENREMVARLDAGDVSLEYEEVPDGHNWENWRDRLRAALLHVVRR